MRKIEKDSLRHKTSVTYDPTAHRGIRALTESAIAMMVGFLSVEKERFMRVSTLSRTARKDGTSWTRNKLLRGRTCS